MAEKKARKPREPRMTEDDVKAIVRAVKRSFMIEHTKAQLAKKS